PEDCRTFAAAVSRAGAARDVRRPVAVQEVGMKPGKLSIALIAFAAIATIGLSAARAQVTPDAQAAYQGDEEDSSKAPPVFEGKRNKNPGPCPTLGVLYDAARLVEMKRPDDKYGSVGFTGEINGVSGDCSYRSNKGATPIEMSLKVKL